MVKILLILSALGANAQMAGWKETLNERVNCSSLAPRGNIKQQAGILEFIVGGNTRIALKRLQFKHQVQFELFLEELEQLALIKLAARNPRPTKEQADIEMVQIALQFIKDEEFLDPMKVCACAHAGMTNDLAKKATTDPKTRVDLEKIREWFAKCITTQFVPTMFDKPELFE